MKIIAVFGATGNQGGSVAKLLLQYPNEYKVKAVTRDPSSDAAQALQKKGAELVQSDMTIPTSLPQALEGCWGVFGVTNFYDGKIKDDPSSEEQQGKNLVDAAIAARVECFIWSTLPSSRQISGGRFVSRIYEGSIETEARSMKLIINTGKYHVDDHIRAKNYPACFLYTGNFYENMILRSHMKFNAASNTIEFHQPIVNPETKLAMLFVEKDLSGIAKAVFDQWDMKKIELTHRYLYCTDARVSPNEILACVEKVSGKKAVYKRLEGTGWVDRDIMFSLYNECGMYGAKEIPDVNVLALGVQFHGIEDFVRCRLLPHLGLTAVEE